MSVRPPEYPPTSASPIVDDVSFFASIFDDYLAPIFSDFDAKAWIAAIAIFVSLAWNLINTIIASRNRKRDIEADGYVDRFVKPIQDKLSELRNITDDLMAIDLNADETGAALAKINQQLGLIQSSLDMRLLPLSNHLTYCNHFDWLGQFSAHEQNVSDAFDALHAEYSVHNVRFVCQCIMAEIDGIQEGLTDTKLKIKC